MDPNKDYFVNHDGKTSGPLGLEEVREKLQSGEFKADDLVVAKGGSEWLQLSEVVQPEELSETLPEDEQEIAEESSNQLTISKGLGIASVLFFLVALLLGTLNSGLGLWAELKFEEGIHSISSTVRLWRMFIIPLGTLSWTAASICLVCADRSYIGKGLLGLLLGFLVLRLLFEVARYLFGFPLQEWLIENFDYWVFIYWLFVTANWLLYCLWAGLMMIRRKNVYRIILLLSLLIHSLWIVIFLAAWGTEVFPDFIRDLISFLNPVQEWLRDHPIFRVSMFWVCGTVIPMIAWLILAFPLVFGKSTRPEPEIEASQA